MSHNSILKVKSFDFAVRIIKLYKFLKNSIQNTNSPTKYSVRVHRLEH